MWSSLISISCHFVWLIIMAEGTAVFLVAKNCPFVSFLRSKKFLGNRQDNAYYVKRKKKERPTR